ncbi:hypothetical protein ANN_25121 [Periplaneta americana]|uniref:Uncharacterized protein n=1 Tax=Periplaneta americana TaxID=6978 RepID=A0ABQ8S0J8_PERAM|nr:hypothetical protein ANN_25121 [Periplaneta americana]
MPRVSAQSESSDDSTGIEFAFSVLLKIDCSRDALWTAKSLIYPSKTHMTPLLRRTEIRKWLDTLVSCSSAAFLMDYYKSCHIIAVFVGFVLILVNAMGHLDPFTIERLRVFENKVLRKIFGAKRDEVTGEWRKLHNTELHALYSSPDIIRNIKSRRLRWAGHVARMGI